MFFEGDSGLGESGFDRGVFALEGEGAGFGKSLVAGFEGILGERFRKGGIGVQGKTLVLVTHKPSMLELVDRVIVLERGRIIAQGPKEQVMRIAATPPKATA